ncbi:hypothetical protein GGC47_004409 [Bosea sp. OAE752]
MHTILHFRTKAAGLSTLLSVGAQLATNDDDRPIQTIRNGGQDTINGAGPADHPAPAQRRADPDNPTGLPGPSDRLAETWCSNRMEVLNAKARADCR